MKQASLTQMSTLDAEALAGKMMQSGVKIKRLQRLVLYTLMACKEV